MTLCRYLSTTSERPFQRKVAAQPCAPAAVVLGIEALHGRFVRFDDGKNLCDGECCGISQQPVAAERPASRLDHAGLGECGRDLL